MATEGRRPSMATEGWRPSMATEGQRPSMATEGWRPSMAIEGRRPMQHGSMATEGWRPRGHGGAHAGQTARGGTEMCEAQEEPEQRGRSHKGRDGCDLPLFCRYGMTQTPGRYVA
jgi:hypothetical protein